MTLTGYQEWVRARWAKKPRAEDLTIATMGLNGEIGEVVEPLLELVVHGSKASELVKKQVRGSKPVDVTALALELGDVIHYATVLANAFGLTLEGVLLSNVAKLEARELKAAAAAALPKEEHLA